MFSEKFKKFIKENILIILSFFFMYITPLIMLVILACEGKTSKISLELWGSVVGFLLIIIYIAKFKKWVNEKKQFEKQEQLKVPVWLRIVQLIITMVGFTVLFLVLATIQDMFEEILVFSIASCVSVFIANIFLIVDSKNKKAHKIKRD